jgi:hypothetical protein
VASAAPPALLVACRVESPNARRNPGQKAREEAETTLRLRRRLAGNTPPGNPSCAFAPADLPCWSRPVLPDRRVCWPEVSRKTNGRAPASARLITARLGCRSYTWARMGNPSGSLPRSLRHQTWKFTVLTVTLNRRRITPGGQFRGRTPCQEFRVRWKSRL